MWRRNKSKTAANMQNQVSEILASLGSDGVNLTIEELIQYQNKSGLINLASQKNNHGKMSGNYLARSKGRGMEFDEVRHYQNGDDIRAIDWRVTARTGKTHTKLFREEIERPVLVVTELSHNLLFGSQLLFKSVQAAHVAALVTWHAKARGDRTGGIIFNQNTHCELKPRSRTQGVLHYLHNLVATHQQSHDEETEINSEQLHHNAVVAFEENCARLRQLAKPGSLVYLITDGFNLSQEAIRHIAHISRHCEVVVCMISDPLEHNLPSSSKKINVAITDGETKQQITLGDDNFAKQYHQQAKENTSSKETLLTNAGARILNFSSGKSLEQQLTDGVASWNR